MERRVRDREPTCLPPQIEGECLDRLAVGQVVQGLQHDADAADNDILGLNLNDDAPQSFVVFMTGATPRS